MHRTPSSIKVGDEAQVEFVCASGVGILGRASLFEEGDFAVDTDSGKERRYKSWHEVLIETSIRRCLPMGKGAIPKVERQPRSTSAKM
jgi:hypothetical protein